MIKAECHSDDRRIEIEFDATAWFAWVGDDGIKALARCGWGGDYGADVVAEFFSRYETKDLFDYIAITQRHPTRTSPAAGFECHVDQGDALAWLAANRPHIILED